MTTSMASDDSKWQARLTEHCTSNNKNPPAWQIISDRRGGRTAWSSTVTIDGQQYQARYWYDGQFVNNAKEDAAEVALQFFGVYPSPGNPPPPQAQQSVYGAIGS